MKVVALMVCVVLLTLGCVIEKKEPKNPKKTVLQVELGSVSGISVTVGETFVVTANGNPTTGYGWRYDAKSGQDVVNLQKEDYKQSNPDPTICGAPGVFFFQFEASHPGKKQLTFTYARPWEKTKFDEKRTLDIEVR